MDEKHLIVICICAVVLLVLGSMSTVAGYQENKNSKNEIDVVGNVTSPSMKSEGLKLLNIRVKTFFYYQYILLLDIQNIGTETIHKISGHGEYNLVFRHKVNHSGSYWLDETLEPGETCIFDVFQMPLFGWQRLYLRIYIDIESDVPGYNHIIINDRYCFNPNRGQIYPMHGILDLLAHLLPPWSINY